jgi:hypothetical protein
MANGRAVIVRGLFIVSWMDKPGAVKNNPKFHKLVVKVSQDKINGPIVKRLQKEFAKRKT